MDKDLILRKAAALETYRDQLREYAGIGLAAYREDWKAQRIVERTLQMMIETCSDIAHHIIADEALRTPTGYGDAFKVLSENSVLEMDLAGTMEKMAKFRNVVVHQYEGVDAEIVVLILHRHLADFDRFRDAVVWFLKKPRVG